MIVPTIRDIDRIIAKIKLGLPLTAEEKYIVNNVK